MSVCVCVLSKSVAMYKACMYPVYRTVRRHATAPCVRTSEYVSPPKHAILQHFTSSNQDRLFLLS